MFSIVSNDDHGSMSSAFCPIEPSQAECIRFISQISDLFDLQNTAKSSAIASPCRLALAVDLLSKHRGFSVRTDHAYPDEELHDKSYDHEPVTADTSSIGSKKSEILQVVASRIIRILLSYDLRPLPPSALDPNICDLSLIPNTGYIVAFECCCRLAGSDAACAMLRDQRASWIHAEIASYLAVQSSRSSRMSSQVLTTPSTSGDGIPNRELPENCIILIDRISLQCDVDLSMVTQIAGRSRWRQFAELYAAAAVDTASRVKHLALSFFQSTISPAPGELARWITACLKAEQLRSRDSFLHKTGQGVSVRPSGSLLKSATMRPTSGDGNDTTQNSASVTALSLANDSTLLRMFSDSINSIVSDNNCDIYDMKATIQIDAIIPIDTQSNGERWPKTVTKGCCILWDLIGSFIQLFYIDCRVNSNGHNSALEGLQVSLMSYVEKKWRYFLNCLAADFARHELESYLIMADLTYLERHFNSLKSSLSSNMPVLQRLATEVRDCIRSKLESMFARLIALNARLLLESLLNDWRRMPIPDGSDNGPPVSLVAWNLHMFLWHLRMRKILPPHTVCHVFLSVALASFERVTIRLLNAKNKHALDVDVALWTASNFLFLAIDCPESFNLSFDDVSNTAGTLPNETKELIASYNALGTTLSQSRQLSGAASQQWMFQNISFMASSKISTLLPLLLCQAKSNPLLTVRLLCVSNVITGIAESDIFHSEPDIILLLNCLHVLSSSDIEPGLMAKFIYYSSMKNRNRELASKICRQFVIQTFCQSQTLSLALSRIRVYCEAGLQFQSLPCGCSSVGNYSPKSPVQLFFEQLALAVECSELSLRLSLGAVALSGGIVPLVIGILQHFCSSGKQDSGFLKELNSVAEVLNQSVKGLPGPWADTLTLSFERISCLTVDKFCQLVKMTERQPVDLDVLSAYIYPEGELMTEAVALELLAAGCSRQGGLNYIKSLQLLIRQYFVVILQNFHLTSPEIEYLKNLNLANCVSEDNAIVLVNLLNKSLKRFCERQ